MDKTEKTLKRLCNVVDVLKKQSRELLDIQKQTHSVDIEYIIVQVKMKDVAEDVLKIMKKLFKESEKND